MENREIKFRGLDVKGNWYYGNLSVIPKNIKGGIESFAYEVRPETVGQYTGLKDNTKWEQLTIEEQKDWIDSGKSKEEWNGKEIYEGDIVKARYYYQYSGSSSNWEWRTKSGEIIFHKYKWIFKPSDHEKINLKDLEDIEIIDNIYENPELIKQLNEA